ncbi:MAG: TRAP transporter small permease, partial [Synergistaceae bacterium]|nr:TRAP transporter small permease [Synergistaceae bacterium]
MKILRWLDQHFEEYVLSGLLVVIAVVMMLQ